MTAYFYDLYVRQIGLFIPDLPIEDDTPDGPVVHDDVGAMFRDVRLFVQQIRRVNTERQFNFHLNSSGLISYTLKGEAKKWHDDLPESLKSASLQQFCDRLMKRFEPAAIQAEKARKAKHQAAEEARIAKEKAEAFACRRCPEKYPSNTKLHEHVRTKHVKPEKPTPLSPTPSAAIATSATVALATPITSPIASPATSLATPYATPTPVTLPTPPTSPIISHATMPTTPKKPISWAEIASRPKTPIMPSRLPRLTIKYGIPTPPPSPPLSPVLQPQKSTNNVTRPPSTTPSFATPLKSYLSVQDLYTKFHGKPKPSSFPTMQNRLPSAPSSGHQMHLRQMHITSYFEPTSNGPACPATLPKAELVPIRQYAHLKTGGQMTWIRDLEFSKPRHPILRTCRRCKQHFTSGNLLHRHIQHCSKGTKGSKQAAMAGKWRKL